MKAISILQFRKNIYAYLTQLPLKVTAKNKVLFYVMQDVSTVDVSTHQVSTVSTTPPENKNSTIPVENKESIKVEGWCKDHFERGVNYPLKHCLLEDINGTQVFEKPLCPKCIERRKAEVKRNGGVLYIDGLKYDS